MRLNVDYAGSSPQLPRAINVVPIYTFAYTAYALKVRACADHPE